MKKIFKFSQKYFLKYKFRLILLFFIILISGLCTLSIPIITGNFIDFLVGVNRKADIYLYCIVFIMITIINILVGFIANRIYTKMNFLLTFNMTEDIIAHAQKISVFYFLNRNISSITQQISIDTKVIVDFCFDFFNNFIINILKLTIPLVIIFSISKIMFAIIMILSLIYLFAYISFKKILYKYNFQVKEEQNVYFSHLYEQLSKIKFLKTHQIEDWFNQKVQSVFANLLKLVMNLQVVQYSYSGLDTFIMSVGQICLFIIGGSLVLQTKISIGEFTLISSYFNMGITAIRYFFSLGQNIQTTLVSYERLIRIENETEEIVGNKKIETIDKIHIEKLSFSYDQRQIIFNQFLDFEKGNSYAILGKNGIGKTTLINIIIGVYQGYSGKIYYNDYDLDEVDIKFLLKNHISVVEQEPVLIQDTLYNNIVLDRCVPEEDVKNLVEVWLDDEKFKDLNIQINEKSCNLSVGEKEKIAIMRAIIKDSDLVIMDEPTAALDKESLKKIEKLIKDKWKDKIIIIITHDDKLASICDCKIRL